MKILIVISFITTLLSCGISETPNTKDNLSRFNKFLGPKKAEVFNQGVNSFDIFLLLNYPNIDSEKRTQVFLEQLLITYTTNPDSSWTFDTESNKELIDAFETSGMRKEIIIYGYEVSKENEEEWDLIPIRGETEDEYKQRVKLEFSRLDSAYSFNIHGLYLTGLSKFTKEDILIQQYVEVRQQGGFSPSFIINAYLKQNYDYENPFFKRMIVADFYLDLMLRDIERNEKMTTR